MEKPERRQRETCKCPYCDAEIDEPAAICVTCEMVIIECVHCGEPVRQGVEKCPHCGKPAAATGN